MGNYVLGVDGGGTKTHCALFDIHGNKVDLVIWGPTNYEVLEGGFAGLKKELEGMIAHILRKNGLTLLDICYSVFGLSGVDSKFQHEQISGLISGLDLKDHILCNDAFLGIKAGIVNQYGICAINGTGCTVAGIDPEGGMLQIGGYGGYSADEGGGSFLGTLAVSSVYNFLYRNGAGTVLKDLLFQYLHIQSKSDFMEAIIIGTAKGEFSVKDFNSFIFKAANLGDEVALGILEGMGKQYAQSINSAIRHLNYNECEELSVVLAGSIHMHGESAIAIDRMMTDVLSENQQIKIVFYKLERPPVMGAIVWAISKTKTTMRFKDLYDKVKLQF